MDAAKRIMIMSQIAEAMPEIMRRAQLPDQVAVRLKVCYPEWEVGESYVKGEIFSFNGQLYRVNQDHTSAAEWVPGQGTESLYTAITVDPETGYDVWQQPTGAHDAYNTGDRVLYPDDDGDVYESLIDGNTWAPDAYPQGWKKVEEE